MLIRNTAVLCLLALCGCATQLPRIPEPESGRGGYAVITIATDKRHSYYSVHAWAFRTIDNTAVDTFTWRVQRVLGFGSNYDFDLPESFGEVQVRALPPGKYHLVNFAITEVRGTFSNSWRGRELFSLPFTIEPGKVTYLGEFLTRSVRARTLIGIPVSVPRYFEITDQMERDLFYARKKVPALPAGAPLKQVPDVSAVQRLYLRNTPARPEDLPPLDQPGVEPPPAKPPTAASVAPISRRSS